MTVQCVLQRLVHTAWAMQRNDLIAYILKLKNGIIASRAYFTAIFESKVNDTMSNDVIITL